jgi:hypothetical protein
MLIEHTLRIKILTTVFHLATVPTNLSLVAIEDHYATLEGAQRFDQLPRPQA